MLATATLRQRNCRKTSHNLLCQAKRKFEIVESLPSTYGASQGSRRNPAKRPKRTTQLLMSRSLPFPVSKKTQMVYTYGYAQPASAAFDYFTIACNDMFDLDRTTLGKLGNKQPTFLTLFYPVQGHIKIIMWKAGKLPGQWST